MVKMDPKQGVVSALLTDFSTSGCMVLTHPDLVGNALMMSNQYVGTQRIREWKPLNDTHTKGSKFCHLPFSSDHDAYLTDPMLAGNACSRDNPAFKNVPFVVDVFENATGQTTNPVGTGKCVVEIDPTKVTRDRLQAFWDGVGVSECMQRNQHVVDLNQTLKSNITSLEQKLSDLRRIHHQNALTLRSQTLQIADLKVELQDVMKDEQNKQNAYDKLQNEVAAAQETYQSLDKTFKTQAANLSSDLSTCQTSRNSDEAQHALKQEQYSNVKNDVDKLDAEFQKLQNRLDKLEMDNNSWTQQSDKISLQSARTSRELADCTKQIKVLSDDLRKCESNNNLLRSAKNAIENELRLTEVQLDECNEMRTLDQNLYDKLTATNDQVLTFIQKSRNTILVKQTDIRKLNATVLAQRREIEELQKWKTSCDAYQARLEEATAEKDDLEKRCRMLRTNVDTLKTFNPVQSKYAEASTCPKSKAPDEMEELAILMTQARQGHLPSKFGLIYDPVNRDDRDNSINMVKLTRFTHEVLYAHIDDIKKSKTADDIKMAQKKLSRAFYDNFTTQEQVYYHDHLDTLLRPNDAKTIDVIRKYMKFNIPPLNLAAFGFAPTFPGW